MQLNDELLHRLERRARSRGFWKEPDLQQFFWVGVLEAASRAKDEGHEEYLFLSGINRVRDEHRRDWSRSLERICEVCGKRYGYRGQTTCCGRPTRTRRRMVEFESHAQWDADPAIIIAIEQFVMTLSGTEREVAQRFLLDRWDLFYANFQRRIADELGISPPAVNRWIKRIRSELRSWLG